MGRIYKTHAHTKRSSGRQDALGVSPRKILLFPESHMLRGLPSYPSWKRIPILPHSTHGAPVILVSSWLLEHTLGWKACLLHVLPAPAPSPSWRLLCQVLSDPHPFDMRAQVQFPALTRQPSTGYSSSTRKSNIPLQPWQAYRTHGIHICSQNSHTIKWT